MAINFKVGRHIDPSGFGLAVIDIPSLDPEKNISLIDTSYKWEENVANVESAELKSYVDSGGHMPLKTIIDFVITNMTTTATNDKEAAPLYYEHKCRFHHYSYGETPSKQVYIVDQNENILKDINYLVTSERISEKVYVISVLTDFQSNEYVSYKIKYNRCLSDGTEIYPSWVETLNATPLFIQGSPLVYTFQYSLYGPTANGLYSAIVPPVPTITELTNSVGLSFETSPTTLKQYVLNNADYPTGVTVKYTLKASGTETFTIQRDVNRVSGSTDNYYLQSATADTWGVGAVNFNLDTEITGIPGVLIEVHGDRYLQANDEAYFYASRSYYYMKPLAYNAVYLKKPKHVVPEDDWYIRVRDGRFRRRMDSEGNVVPSGQGTLWEYAVPEYNTQLWNLTYGPPYKDEINERAEVIDRENIQLQRTPIHIDPSSVLYNPDNPGFPPSGFMHIKVNDSDVEQNSILDWDVYTGKVRLAHTLTHRDDISVNYTYKEKFYEYSGFVGSGGIYTSTPPFPFEELDLNPTPGHNYGMFSSGNAAHVFLRPYMDVDNAVVVTNEGLYHNYTGVASGVYDFELGSLSLGPHCKIRDVELTDIRRRGGGLSVRGQENLDDVTSVQPEAEFFWDVGYFDGQAVPSNGVLVVDISNDLLTGNGGPFTESEIRQKVLKHMPLGSYPIINYVDGDRTIIKADDVKVYSAAGVYKFRYVGAVGETASLYCVGTKYEIKNNEDGFLVWDSDNANSSEYKFLNNGDSTSTTAGSYTLTIVFDGPGSLLFTVTIELT